MAATQAQTAKKAALKGTNGSKTLKYRSSTIFRRPKVLELPKKPEYQRKAVAHYPRMDSYDVIISPLNTETAMKKIEDSNTLVFIVNKKANKYQIRDAIKKLYEVEIASVNTLIRPDGKKKAFVRLTADHDALDIANKIGYI